MTEVPSNNHIKIAVAGAGGRMGCRIIALVAESSHYKISGALEATGHPAVGRDAGLVAGCGELKISVTSEPSKALENADVLIDFSVPAAITSCGEEAISRNIAVVVGTTGLSEEELAVIESASKSIPVITAPNMSVGVNLLFKIAPMVAKALGSDYDIEIIESHHNRKKDAPSGTAVRLLEGLQEARNLGPESAVHGREGLPGERPQNEIGVHAVRAGDIVGEHTVIFATGGERIELIHRASSRDTFANGAIRAAGYLKGRAPGRYSMDDVLFGD